MPIPAASPRTPKMALPSPPARRSMTRQGQPRKTRAPIMASIPRMKRTMGADPARAWNSLNMRAEIKAPRTNPRISGLRYCTTSARCRPMAPAMSRSKQATQMPMLPGFPNFCRRAAATPIKAPTLMMPVREAKKSRHADIAL